MKKGCKKLFSLILAIACLFSMNLNVLADTPAENGTNSISWQVSKSKKASPTELSGTDKTTRVTLSLPSAEEELTSDVVFVLDSSSCSKQVITEKMPQLLQNLYSSISASKAKLNVGVVMFRGNAITAYPLQEYTGSIAPIAAAIANGVIELNSASALHGSNMPSGLDAAKAMLAASSTPGNRKHMILVGDGATYLYTHDEDPSTCFSRTSGYYSENGSLYEWHAKYAAGNGNGFPFPPSFTGGGNASDWNSFIGSIAAVRSNFTQYDQAYVRSAIHPDPALTVPDPPVDLNTFVTNVEESLYQCVKEFTDMSASGISCYAINAADGDMGVFTTFMNYLGSSLGKGTSTDFSNIEKNILYLFSSGSVTDTIGSDFNLVTNETSGPFTLTLGGTALSSVNTGTNEWSFGTPDANGTYPYVVTYVPGTDEKFTWRINVPVKNAEQLQLSYNLLLTASPSVTTTYPTNQSADLAYTSSDSSTAGTETFEVPTVTYTPAKVKTPAVIDPPVQKLITGDTPNAASDFTFILKAGDAGCPMPSGSSGVIKKTVISGSGKSEFGEISYSEPGTYNYTCYEVNSAVSGYTYDANIYTLKVVVTENDSAYAASAVFTKSDGSAADGFIFSNLYKKKGPSTSVSGPSETTTPACSTVTPACSAVPSSCSTVPSSQKAGDAAGTITPSYNTAVSSPKTGDDSPLAALIALFFISALCIAVTGDKMLNRSKKQK